MKNNIYWSNRSKERMMEYHKDSDKTISLIVKAYDKAIQDIEEDIKKIVGTYSANGELSPSKARRYLNQKIPNFILDIIRKLYPEIKNSNLKRWMLSKLNAPAYRARITRLEALEESVYLRTKLLVETEIELSKNQYMKTINSAYYRNIIDIQKGLGLGLGFDFATMPSQVIEEILKNPWSSKHFSERVWNNTDVLAENITEIITSGFMSGKSYRSMAKKIEEFTDHGKYAAMRLVRTETTFMANAAEIESYKKCGIDKYIYVATLDLRTSKECRELDRQVFEVSKAVAGENLPPMHPHCRSTTRAYLGPDTLKNIQRRARDPKTGKTYLIPADMNYEEWYQKYVVDKYGQDQAEVMEKKIKNKASDKEQHRKYRAIFGNEIPSTLDDFQELKYNNINEWEDIKAKKQETLNSLDYKESLNGKLGNKEVREWYISHDKNIPNLIDKSKGIEVQAKEAHTLRNKYRTEARLMMQDRVEAENLNKKHPNSTFEELLEHKKNKYGLEGEEAYKDIIRSSQTTNKKVNEKLRIDEEG